MDEDAELVRCVALIANQRFAPRFTVLQEAMLAADMAAMGESSDSNGEGFGSVPVPKHVISRDVLAALPQLSESLAKYTDTSVGRGNGTTTQPSTPAQTPPVSEHTNATSDDDDYIPSSLWDDFLASTQERAKAVSDAERRFAGAAGAAAAASGARSAHGADQAAIHNTDDSDSDSTSAGGAGSTWTSAGAILRGFEDAGRAGLLPVPDWDAISAEADRVMQEHHADVLSSTTQGASPPHSPLAGGGAADGGGSQDTGHPPPPPDGRGAAPSAEGSQHKIVSRAAQPYGSAVSHQRLQKLQAALSSIDQCMARANSEHAAMMQRVQAEQQAADDAVTAAAAASLKAFVLAQSEQSAAAQQAAAAAAAKEHELEEMRNTMREQESARAAAVAQLARTQAAAEAAAERRGSLLLQRWWRGHKGRQAANTEHSRRSGSATLFQRLWRGHVGRVLFRHLRNKRELERAAATAAAAAKQAEEQAAAAAAKAEMERQAAEVAEMQRLVREAHAAREEAVARARSSAETAARAGAALRIQCAARQRLSRAQRDELKRRRARQHCGALGLQRLWRGARGRQVALARAAEHMSTRNNAAVHIQRIARGHLGRGIAGSAAAQATNARQAARQDAARAVQSMYRGVTWRREHLPRVKIALQKHRATRSSAVTKLQAAVRGWLLRGRVRHALEGARWEDADDFEYEEFDVGTLLPEGGDAYLASLSTPVPSGGVPAQVQKAQGPRHTAAAKGGSLPPIAGGGLQVPTTPLRVPGIDTPPSSAETPPSPVPPMSSRPAAHSALQRPGTGNTKHADAGDSSVLLQDSPEWQRPPSQRMRQRLMDMVHAGRSMYGQEGVEGGGNLPSARLHSPALSTWESRAQQIGGGAGGGNMVRAGLRALEAPPSRGSHAPPQSSNESTRNSERWEVVSVHTDGFGTPASGSRGGHMPPAWAPGGGAWHCMPAGPPPADVRQAGSELGRMRAQLAAAEARSRQVDTAWGEGAPLPKRGGGRRAFHAQSGASSNSTSTPRHSAASAGRTRRGVGSSGQGGRASAPQRAAAASVLAAAASQGGAGGHHSGAVHHGGHSRVMQQRAARQKARQRAGAGTVPPAWLGGAAAAQTPPQSPTRGGTGGASTAGRVPASPLNGVSRGGGAAADMGGVRAMSPVVSPGAAGKGSYTQEKVALPALGHVSSGQHQSVRRAW